MDAEPKSDQVEDIDDQLENNKEGAKIIRSPLKNFSRKEFIVLKGNVFDIQSISPKKIILRIKGQNPKLPDGAYVIQKPGETVKE